MKTVAAFVVIAAILACAAAQTHCASIMSALAGAGSQATNEADVIKLVVGQAVNNILGDASIARYFSGMNGYTFNVSDPARAGVLVGKLNSWFFTALGCVNNTDSMGMNITVYTQAELDLTASHAALKVSRRDALVFNTIVVNTAAGILTQQGVQSATLAPIGTTLTNALAATLPQVIGTNGRSSICDRFSDSLSLYLLSGNITATSAFPGNATTDSFKAIALQSGLGFAFWSTFVDWFVIKGAIVSNTTIANTLLPYFRPPVARIDFTDIGAGSGSNYNALIRKLAAYFGVATGCTDVEFTRQAFVNGNLTASHHYLYISRADSNLFNTVIANVATGFQSTLNSILANSMTNEDLTTIVGLLNSLEPQIVNPNPRPAPAAAPRAPTPVAGSAPSGSVSAPRSSATAVAASGFVVLAASALALLF